MVRGDVHYYVKIWLKLTNPPSKTSISNQYSLVAPQLKTFFAIVTAEALRANISSKSAISLQRGPADPKFKVERVAPP